MTQLTVPDLEVYGNTYIVTWSEGVKVRMERIYEHRDGCLALFVVHGVADFDGMTFRPLP